MAQQWRYRLFGEEFGPVSREALDELIADGTLGADDEVAPVGGNWQTAAACRVETSATESGGAPEVDADLASLLKQLDASPSSAGPSAVSRGAATEDWFARVLGEEVGPFDWDALTAMVAHDQVTPTDEVRQGLAGRWQPAGEIVGLFADAAQAGADQELEHDAVPWYVRIDGQQAGPIPYDTIHSLASRGRLSPTDHVREGHQGNWLRAATLPGLFTALEQARSIAGQAAQASAAAHDTPPPSAEAPPPPVATQRDPTPVPPHDSPAEAPPDKWSQFFDDAEVRQQKKYRRKPLPPAPKSAPARAVATVVPAVAPVTSPPPIARATAPLPPTPTPAATSAATPPPPPRVSAKASLRLPSFNFSGVLDKLRGSGGGGGVSTKALAVLGVAALVAVFRFVPLSLAGNPGAEDYPQLANVWQRALRLKVENAPPEKWAELKTEVLPLIDEMQARLAPEVAARGADVPIAQRILWMVDTSNGPTSAAGYLRRVLDNPTGVEDTVYTSATSIMSEASNLVSGN